MEMMEITDAGRGADRSSAAAQEHGRQSRAEGRAIGARFGAVWNCTRRAAGLAEIDELFASDFVNHDPVTGPTREDYKRELALYCQAFPDLVATPQHVIADGDLVMVRWTARGTYAGGLGSLGIDDGIATGRAVTLKGIDVLRIERGAIAERWGEFDAIGMIGQLNAR